MPLRARRRGRARGRLDAEARDAARRDVLQQIAVVGGDLDHAGCRRPRPKRCDHRRRHSARHARASVRRERAEVGVVVGEQRVAARRSPRSAPASTLRRRSTPQRIPVLGRAQRRSRRGRRSTAARCRGRGSGRRSAAPQWRHFIARTPVEVRRRAADGRGRAPTCRRPAAARRSPAADRRGVDAAFAPRRRSGAVCR